MFVESLLPEARERLVTIADDAHLIEAARLLGSGTDILLVCSATGILRGVVVLHLTGVCLTLCGDRTIGWASSAL